MRIKIIKRNCENEILLNKSLRGIGFEKIDSEYFELETILKNLNYDYYKFQKSFAAFQIVLNLFFDKVILVNDLTIESQIVFDIFDKKDRT